MIRPALSCAFGASLSMLIAVAPGYAAHVCDVQRTPDGFVALRAGPSPDARLLARMRPGHMVHGDGRHAGNWSAVTYWSDGQVPIETDPRFREGLRGWVHSRLIGDCG